MKSTRDLLLAAALMAMAAGTPAEAADEAARTLDLLDACPEAAKPTDQKMTTVLEGDVGTWGYASYGRAPGGTWEDFDGESETACRMSGPLSLTCTTNDEGRETVTTTITYSDGTVTSASRNPDGSAAGTTVRTIVCLNVEDGENWWLISHGALESNGQSYDVANRVVKMGSRRVILFGGRPQGTSAPLSYWVFVRSWKKDGTIQTGRAPHSDQSLPPMLYGR